MSVCEKEFFLRFPKLGLALQVAAVNNPPPGVNPAHLFRFLCTLPEETRKKVLPYMAPDALKAMMQGLKPEELQTLLSSLQKGPQRTTSKPSKNEVVPKSALSTEGNKTADGDSTTTPMLVLPEDKYVDDMQLSSDFDTDDESYVPDPEVEPFHKEVAEMMHSFGDASRSNPFVVRMVSGHVREWVTSLLAVAMKRKNPMQHLQAAYPIQAILFKRWHSFQKASKTHTPDEVRPLEDKKIYNADEETHSDEDSDSDSDDEEEDDAGEDEEDDSINKAFKKLDSSQTHSESIKPKQSAKKSAKSASSSPSSSQPPRQRAVIKPASEEERFARKFDMFLPDLQATLGPGARLRALAQLSNHIDDSKYREYSRCRQSTFIRRRGKSFARFKEWTGAPSKVTKKFMRFPSYLAWDRIGCIVQVAVAQRRQKMALKKGKEEVDDPAEVKHSWQLEDERTRRLTIAEVDEAINYINRRYDPVLETMIDKHPVLVELRKSVKYKKSEHVVAPAKKKSLVTKKRSRKSNAATGGGGAKDAEQSNGGSQAPKRRKSAASAAAQTRKPVGPSDSAKSIGRLKFSSKPVAAAEVGDGELHPSSSSGSSVIMTEAKVSTDSEPNRPVPNGATSTAADGSVKVSAGRKPAGTSTRRKPPAPSDDDEGPVRKSSRTKAPVSYAS